MKDHPRSRGVYWISVTLEAAKRGSSPLARGLHGPMAVTRMKARIIPARAGFTPTCTGRAGGPGDHPRSRGVYMLEQLFGDRPEGSSPLARGLPRDGQETTVPNGIIPARAGFTGEATIRGLRRPDHPRSRGVYSLVRGRAGAGAGSPPLARGLQRLLDGDRTAGRIIPARAGFTASGSPPRTAIADHPRSRGVYGGAEVGAPAALRIIPARAGFTIPVPAPGRGNTDHPRSRGVYRSCTAGTSSSTGIIPARAGFTRRSRRRRSAARDHPRSRGVYRVRPVYAQ